MTLLFGANNIGLLPGLRYLPPGFGAVAVAHPVEFEVLDFGTARNMTVLHNSPQPEAVNLTYTLRINGAPTALSLVLSADGFTAADESNQLDLYPGSLVSLTVDVPGPLVNDELGVAISIRAD
jgi:hypothetical protein